jgi:hypothetical protein
VSLPLGEREERVSGGVGMALWRHWAWFGFGVGRGPSGNDELSGSARGVGSHAQHVPLLA